MVERANALCKRVFGLLHTPIKIKGKPTSYEVKGGRVKFENVYFKHFGNLVLEDINFEIKPKMKVAIMGPTGSGKSSLVNLIPRFYDVSKGRVLVEWMR
ncbi:ABC transporter ATP-binding protein/permease [Caldicellulosiruptor naganoensis]|uniref:ABC transporter ATP-binding protein/permease n=1 Tax=Caldicellulosiruptor naganoensis TaxID=29324 RepID=A0ABY7BM74_9FIRM|nr:ABC transporter ATP-binding protein/permease [Caldicellulosiruptor naganoensis]